MKHRMKVGTAVHSTFRAGWHGVIIGQASTNEDCYYVMPILTSKGHTQRKPVTQFLHRFWLEPSGCEEKVLEVARGELRNRILKTEGIMI